jgi:hypothetical protein
MWMSIEIERALDEALWIKVLWLKALWVRALRLNAISLCGTLV